jgi:hypothetical protein
LTSDKANKNWALLERARLTTRETIQSLSKRLLRLLTISLSTPRNSSTRKHSLVLIFLRFSQVAETKLHEVDERLDEIEQIMALYEAKLESVPEEYFTDMPFLP